MRRPTLLAALVLAVVLLAAVPVVASEARATLEASLTGEKEVPGPGDPNGRGQGLQSEGVLRTRSGAHKAGHGGPHPSGST
jgi:hypothetical protein